jgi:hypothetical protein
MRAAHSQRSSTTCVTIVDVFTAYGHFISQPISESRCSTLALTIQPRSTSMSPHIQSLLLLCRAPHLKRQGRCATKPIQELLEDTQEEVALTPDEQEESPAGGQVLASVSEDSKVFGSSAWTPVFSSHDRQIKGQVMGLRSNRWPGALAMTHRQELANLYVGWGIKNEPYVPMPPPPVAEEYDQSQLKAVDLPVKHDPSAPPPSEDIAEA